MKILHISPLPPTLGGISIFAENLIEYLRYYPDGMSLVLCNSADKMRSVVSKSLVVRLFTGTITSIRIYFKVRKIIRIEAPQLIHLSTSSSLALLRDIIILKLAQRSKIPVVVHWHFGRIPNLSVQHNWEWKLLSTVVRKSACSIVIDNKSYKTLISAGFDNVQYIPNPVGLEFEQKAKAFSENIHKRVQNRIIFVGHIIKDKGVYELVEACMQLPVIKELLLIGPYEKIIKKELLTIASKRDKGAWLKLPGVLSRKNVLEQMQSSTILILPSYTEGFPNVVLESMAMGCAVIATDVGAIPEMLAVTTKSPCGICVPIKNIEKLKEALFALIQDPNLAESMGHNGIDRILNNYTLEKVVSQYRSIWNGCTK